MRRKKRKSWRARYYELRAELRGFEDRIVDLEDELESYRSRDEDERLRQRMNWSDYDVAQSKVTRAEQELFEASPAYKRYQQLREDRERRGTGDWRLKRGDWRVP